MRKLGHRDHHEVGRALSFGADADAYDRGRPGLPPGIVDALVPNGTERVLDVGCGTGKGAVPIAARGCSVLGIEPDPAMAAVARGHGIDVEIGTFESWESDGRTFDLVTAVQAWHWIDPTTGPAKAAELLNPGGRLAPVTYYRSVADPDIAGRIRPVYEELEPGLTEISPILGGVDSGPEIERHRAAIVASGRFGEPEIVRELWVHTLSIDGWSDLTVSHSDHKALGPARHQALIDGVRSALDGVDSVSITYETIAIIAPLIA